MPMTGLDEMARRIGKRIKNKFLQELLEHGNVTTACAVVGKSRTAMYDVKAADEDFAHAWKLAIDAFVDGVVQDEVLSIAANGYKIRSKKRGVSAKKGSYSERIVTQKRHPLLALRVLERRHPDYMPQSKQIQEGGVTGVLIVPPMIDDPDEFDAAFGIQSSEENTE